VGYGNVAGVGERKLVRRDGIRGATAREETLIKPKIRKENRVA